MDTGALSVINFVCWKWEPTGWRAPYRVEHVNALYRMLSDKMRLKFNLICLTDRPLEKGYLAGIDVQPLWKDLKLRVPTAPSKPNCYTRLKLFDPKLDHPIARYTRVISIDLDCIIFDDLSPLFDNEPFKIVKGRVCPYNGSMWQINFGHHHDVYTKFDPKKSPFIASSQLHNGRNYYGSDQAWLSHMIKDAPVWHDYEGVYQTNRQQEYDMIHPKVLFFPGGCKPWSQEFARRHQKLYLTYRNYM